MRIRLIGGSVAIALVALFSSAAPSQAYIPQPWCSDSIEQAAGAPVCAYSSYHQCVENTSRGGCVGQPVDRTASDSARFNCFLTASSRLDSSLNFFCVVLLPLRTSGAIGLVALCWASPYEVPN